MGSSEVIPAIGTGIKHAIKVQELSLPNLPRIKTAGFNFLEEVLSAFFELTRRGLGQGPVKSHGYEVGVIGDQPMREVSTDKSDGFDHDDRR